MKTLLTSGCTNQRGAGHIIYRWDFQKGDEHRSIEVPGQVCVNETTLGVELALKDVGITYCLEERVADHIKTGELHIVLPDWSPIEPAMHLYYPGHRQVPQGLKELIEVLRSAYLDIT
ncbi:LysR substrate-binding domain-containing protein [Klebsiella pneumoniae]|uniref:LysR substrate-binding domain-containing protein n=1 Tax=Klebsiella pneumoniae TaxID=573 RepID=UPI001F5F2820|nr:LysR substrate-binding domain-containing protein [Klebsiella pneumoniae]